MADTVQTQSTEAKYDSTKEAYVFLSDDAGLTPLEAAMAARRVDSIELEDYLRSAKDAGLTVVVVPVAQAFAAPDLLAALEETRTFLSVYAEQTNTVRHVLARVEAAIAKAEGGAA